MSDSKRYYWFKCGESFLNGNLADYILRQPNGFVYFVLFEKLCLKAVNSDGFFVTKIGDLKVPWTLETLQQDLKLFDIDQIRVGLSFLHSVGLIYQVDGTYRINNFQNFVGSETVGAERQRTYRNKKAEEKAEQMKISLSNATDNVNFQKPAESSPVIQSDKQRKSSQCQNDAPKGYFSKSLMDLYYRFKEQIEFVKNDSDIKNCYLSRGKAYYFDSPILYRLLNLSREIVRHESYLINGVEIVSEDIIKAYYGFFNYNGEDLHKAFQSVDCEIEKGLIKNEFNYTIVSLYNYAIVNCY